MKKDLVIFGIQGSGKGTQAGILAKEFNGAILGTGDIFRKLSQMDSPIAQEVKEVMSRGELINDELVFGLVRETYQKLRENNDMIIFDGFPRNLSQVHMFQEYLAEQGRDFEVIVLELSRETSYKRIASRAEIEGRPDDAQKEIIEQRIETFFSETSPVIEFFKTEGKVISIDGEQSIAQVTSEILNKLHLSG